jgi:hypothetical protein
LADYLKSSPLKPLSGFRGEDFLEINQSETRIACDAMFVNGSGRNEQSL